MFFLFSLGIFILFFCFYWSKFFFLLIILEGIMLVLFAFLFICVFYFHFSFELVFLFLSMMVIEGVFGLSLIIFMIWVKSGEKFGILGFF